MDMVRHAAAAAFSYEAIALESGGRLPPITRLCGNRYLASACTVALIAHFIVTRRALDRAAAALAAAAGPTAPR
jgi:hypothetical protein